MKRVAIVVFLLAFGLIATNPTQDEYVSWLKQQAMTGETAKNGDAALVSLFGGPILNLMTTRKNFMLFSTYTTETGTQTTESVLGILRLFVPLGSQSSLPAPHVVAANSEGRWLPEDGYIWVINPPVAGDFRVQWNPGQRSSINPHVVAAPAEGRWLPENGYIWVANPPVAGDFRVRWNAGQRSSINPHVVAAPAEGRWLPENGYIWVANPPVAGDFRVRPLSGN